MPELTPSGPFSTPLVALRAALAAQTAFRTWCGADTEGEALAQVRVGEVDTEQGDTMPARPFLALCLQPGSYTEHPVAIDTWAPGSVIQVDVFGTIGSAYQTDPHNAEVDAGNSMATLLTCLRAAAGVATTYGRIVFREPFVVRGPTFPEIAEDHTERYPSFDALILAGVGV